MLSLRRNRHHTGQRGCSRVVGRIRRLLEGRALRSLDPCSIRIRELERHNTRAPSLRLRLVNARPERRRVDEPVRRISSRSRLPNHELVQLDTIGRNLEHRRARERSPRRVQESLAVRVQALVVELDVVLERPCEHKNNYAT